MKKHNRIFRSLIAIIVAMLMVGTLIPTAVAAGTNDVAVVADDTQNVSPFEAFIQTIKDFFQSIINFFKNLINSPAKPVDPDSSAAMIQEILAAEEGAVIDGKGMTVSVEDTILIKKNITLKNITFKAEDANAYAVNITPAAASVTLESCNIIGRFWVSGKDIVLKDCTFDTNMNVDGVDGLTVEGCTFTALNPITFGSTVANVTIKNNIVAVPVAQIRIHENVTSLTKVVIVNNTLPFSVIPDLGAAEVYAQAVATGNFLFIK